MRCRRLTGVAFGCVVLVQDLEPPLLRRHYARGSGTLYTAIYRPTERTLELRWPAARRFLRLDPPEEGVHLARYEAEE